METWASTNLQKTAASSVILRGTRQANLLCGSHTLKALNKSSKATSTPRLRRYDVFTYLLSHSLPCLGSWSTGKASIDDDAGNQES